MKIKEIIDKLRFKAENIKAHIEPEFFYDVADVLEKYQWIDVKDRMPEEDKEVLICSQWGTIDVGWHYDTYWATEHNTYEDVGDIVAWMPLPEPYKLSKKKQFSQDTLNFFKMIDKKYKWIAKDKSGDIFGFEEKPKKDKYVWLCEEYDYCLDNTCCIDGLNQSLFDQILWEDEEPIYIDDYVER